jgi:hypothetical protein
LAKCWLFLAVFAGIFLLAVMLDFGAEFTTSFHSLAGGLAVIE